MSIHYQDNRATLYAGNCLDVMKGLDDQSVDAVVTDPPYELGFMGKSWDASGIAFNVDVWREALRVLKPGGHLLAFSGSRTYHRMAVAIEDAGFEIRDQIQWIYGSGFPKSMDVSKQIDKFDATAARRERDLKFTEWMRSTGITSRLINDLTNSNMANHYLTDKEQPTVATAEMFDKLRPHLPQVPEYIEEMVRQRTIESENYKKRPVTGQHDAPAAAQQWMANYDKPADLTPKERRDIAATSEAEQWQGWGTALKPAHEPIVLARKPLIGTVAKNILAHGVGAINIDGTRIGDGTGETKTVNYPDIRGNNYNNASGSVEYTVVDKGRFPANVIHDGSDEALHYFGEPARFFYCAKTSKKDRNEGLEDFEGKSIGAKGNGLARSCATCGASVLQGCECPDRTFVNPTRANHHPTVKPTELMRYLVRMITPPQGVVLDPFLGSGSTGKAAMLEGNRFIGIELTEEYLPIALARIQFAQATPLEEQLFPADFARPELELDLTPTKGDEENAENA